MSLVRPGRARAVATDGVGNVWFVRDAAAAGGGGGGGAPAWELVRVDAAAEAFGPAKATVQVRLRRGGAGA